MSFQKIVIVIFYLLITAVSLSIADDLQVYKERANSDDAQSIDDTFFHAEARAFVITNVVPNKLRVGGREFRVKRNPVGKGCFVYDPRTSFNGVERNLVWWVPYDRTAYPLNSPSKMVTPSLKWSREDGIDAPSTGDVINYIFEKKPMKPIAPRPRTSISKADLFTVKEYNIYRSVINSSMSVPEAEVLDKTGKRYGVTSALAKKITVKVSGILSRKGWYGSANSEIRHASDWNGEKL